MSIQVGGPLEDNSAIDARAAELSHDLEMAIEHYRQLGKRTHRVNIGVMLLTVGTSLIAGIGGLADFVGAKVIGALALTPLAERLGRRRVLLADLALLPVLLVLYGLAPSLPIAAAALLAVGAAYIGVLAGLNTVVQLRAPEVLRGRILSLYMLALGVIYPIGAIVQGAVADHLGLRTVVVGTAVLLFAVLIAFYVGRPHLAASLDDPRRGHATLDAVASRVA